MSRTGIRHQHRCLIISQASFMVARPQCRAPLKPPLSAKKAWHEGRWHMFIWDTISSQKLYFNVKIQHLGAFVKRTYLINIAKSIATAVYSPKELIKSWPWTVFPVPVPLCLISISMTGAYPGIQWNAYVKPFNIAPPLDASAKRKTCFFFRVRK